MSQRRFLDYLTWLYNPLTSWEVTRVYDLLSTDVATTHGLYLNLGYWSDAGQTLDEACEALTDLVAERAGVNPGDQVVDVGFGFADQDLRWAKTRQPARIRGLNITASQVAIARERVANAGLADRIELVVGSATAMPFATASADQVLAQECAFHFKTRADFFAEAFRVLRPGGRLVTADIIPMPPATSRWRRLKQRWSWGLVASKFAIPKDNVYGVDGYVERLEAAGFASVEVQSIRDRVYAPLHEALRRHPQILQRLHPATRLPARIALAMSAESVYGGLDYILATAVKPTDSPASA
ncbi:SAM-dependent methyltransferase [Thiocapsa imhoffii]|uniref:SAM-dependent methyltransferase n=1 Tax=Thiocapsa imhoffii TaxID=382777 RepID=A0A9X0WI97_9GAMM|nr:methyltransferase domain-containing protein [Thiocapsa imhoffii]MBK1645252.1 SAM-dependent methyltransferase [Thiocapsa imhoffii]